MLCRNFVCGKALCFMMATDPSNGGLIFTARSMKKNDQAEFGMSHAEPQASMDCWDITNQWRRYGKANTSCWDHGEHPEHCGKRANAWTLWKKPTDSHMKHIETPCPCDGLDTHRQYQWWTSAGQPRSRAKQRPLTPNSPAVPAVPCGTCFPFSAWRCSSWPRYAKMAHRCG